MKLWMLWLNTFQLDSNFFSSRYISTWSIKYATVLRLNKIQINYSNTCNQIKMLTLHTHTHKRVIALIQYKLL